MIIATSMLAMVLITVATVMRTGRQAWEAHAADYSRVEAAHAVARHIVRQVRQSASVSSISLSTDDSGRLTLTMPDSSTVVWDHDSGTNSVNYGVTNPTGLLAQNITGLRFTGYRANGTTITSTPQDIRALKIDVTFQLPVQAGATRVVSTWAWIRCW